MLRTQRLSDTAHDLKSAASKHFSSAGCTDHSVCDTKAVITIYASSGSA